jgi:hypothetical protein
MPWPLFCACCGAEITLKTEACSLRGAPQHGMLQPDLLSTFAVITEPFQDDECAPSENREQLASISKGSLSLDLHRLEGSWHIATCPTIRKLRSRDWSMTIARPPSFRESFGLTRREWYRGTRPNNTPVRIETAVVKTTTRQSTAISATRGTSAGRRRASAGTPTIIRRNPNKPPAEANTRLSVYSCRATLLRLAPRAMRRAISFCSVAPRVSMRFAMFAQASRSTIATVARSVNRTRRTPPITC